MLQQEIQIWQEVLMKKVTMQRNKIKAHTEACYPCKKFLLQNL